MSYDALSNGDGLGSGCVTEQTIMRSLKSTGGLTRGSGMTEYKRSIWIRSASISSAYDYVMHIFNSTVYPTREQQQLHGWTEPELTW